MLKFVIRIGQSGFRHCAPILIASISTCLGLSMSVAAETSRPNIVLIFIDDQGYYDLGCYGATEVETPRIDGMAADGVRFTNFYSAAPICSPSRAGLLTGAYPRRTGNEIWVHRPDAKDGIPAERLTIAELLKDDGYSTACIGKWHLGFQDEFLPWNQGFEYYYGILHNLDDYEVVHFEEEGGMPLQRNQDIIRRDVPPGELAGLYTDEAIDWIEQCVSANNDQKPSEPFFLYLPHTMLHEPLGVSSEFKGTSNWGLYGDAIHEMDFQVGRILDALDSLKIADDTIVIYASDNGRWPGRNKDQPIRGSKLTTYEGGLRIPFIIKGPSIREGYASDIVAHAMDVYPTLATFAGTPVPDEVILDGRDLSALLEGDTDQVPTFDESVSLNAEVPLRRHYELDREWSNKFTQEEYLTAFFYHGSHGALSAVRSGPWKLTLHPNLKLYNLEEDPGERKELVAIWPKKGEGMSKTEAARQRAKNWEIKTKLRGMVVLFQREMKANNQ